VDNSRQGGLGDTKRQRDNNHVLLRQAFDVAIMDHEPLNGSFLKPITFSSLKINGRS
jgi:hypothetical protein